MHSLGPGVRKQKACYSACQPGRRSGDRQKGLKLVVQVPFWSVRAPVKTVVYTSSERALWIRFRGKKSKPFSLCSHHHAANLSNAQSGAELQTLTLPACNLSPWNKSLGSTTNRQNLRLGHISSRPGKWHRAYIVSQKAWDYTYALDLKFSGLSPAIAYFPPE